MSRSIETRHSGVFAHEIKFLLTPERAQEVRAWSRRFLLADPHAGGESGDGYQVTSLYLDTEDMAVFQRRGSYGRSKYRVRRYGDSDTIFLERKMKTRKRVGKIRSLVALEESERLASASVPKEWGGYWFHRRLGVRRLRPVCQISYQRTARIAMTSLGPIRLTIDEDLWARPAEQFVFAPAGTGTPLFENKNILELKYRIELPGLFAKMMKDLGLQPESASKYRAAVTGLGLAREIPVEDVCLTS